MDADSLAENASNAQEFICPICPSTQAQKFWMQKYWVFSSMLY